MMNTHNLGDALREYIDVISEARERIAQANQKTQKPRVEMFFSFDIVNSSDYKERNRYDWPIIFRNVLKQIRDSVNREFGEEDAVLWRVIGDELIFVAKVSDLNLLHENVKSVFKIVYSLSHDLKTGDFFKKMNTKSKAKRYVASNTLSLKAAVWIALVTEQDELGEYENLATWYDRPENQGNLQEFLGPDIDAGFRVKNHTKAGRLAVSFELACLLSERTESLQCLHIMSYEMLKGVWHGDYYPIIWYHMESEAGKFQDSFQYDERIKDPMVCRYFEREQLKPKDVDSESKIPISMYQDVAAALHKISQDQALESKIGKIRQVIEAARAEDWVQSKDPFFNDDSRIQMHFAAVCFDPAENKILVAKRSLTKKVLPGKWEFGCAKATAKRELVEQIQQEYRKDFQIDISVMLDSTRGDQQPVPLALYKIDQKRRSGEGGIKHEVGIIVLAKINRPFDPNRFHETGKHSEIRMIGRAEIETFCDDDCVPDFKNTLRKAFEMLSDKSSESQETPV